MAGFRFDATSLLKGLDKVQRQADDELRGRALFQVANEILRDAINEVPKAPFDEGHLRGSARVTRPDVQASKASIEAGFNIVYAARWHELTPDEDRRIAWTLPGSGRKYLESKLSRFREKYLFMLSRALGRAIRGKGGQHD